jgi:hypothetical protein
LMQPPPTDLVSPIVTDEQALAVKNDSTDFFSSSGSIFLI